MREWVQETEPVASRPEGLDAVRDPFIVEVEGRRWALQGAGTADGRAPSSSTRAMTCTPGTTGACSSCPTIPWPPSTAPAVIWECPQLVQVDGTWVVMVSPLIGEQGTPLSFDRVAWLAGDLTVVER